ncbi:unnamed protein product [Symbiodinium natans]|uniref:Uncharacterized protein n=1 Tax=Symbiodinium natans TaxID=878477 RepID=A0A812HZN9_9DINO|nr:unnamed protein product [Symbiodinium natans]
MAVGWFPCPDEETSESKGCPNPMPRDPEPCDVAGPTFADGVSRLPQAAVKVAVASTMSAGFWELPGNVSLGEKRGRGELPGQALSLMFFLRLGALVTAAIGMFRR